jgi:hypothetical protein
MIPVTKEEFRSIGERYDSEDVIAQVDELFPLAVAYVAVLPGYDDVLLDELTARRAELLENVSARRRQRKEAKQGTRKAEARLVRQGKWLNRTAVTLAQNAVRSRVPAEGETEQESRRIADRLSKAIEAQQGATANDSTAVQTRLEGAKKLLTDEDIAARVVALSKGVDYVARIDAMLPKLKDASVSKSTEQQRALTGTADLDELDGRIYTNLKSLVDSGRSYFNSQGDTTKAGLFNLKILNKSSRKKKAPDEPGEPAGE